MRMRIGGEGMKILKIEDGQGYFLNIEDNKWIGISEIDKDALEAILDTFLLKDVSMDEYDEEEISNPAQQIVYRSIYEKLMTLLKNKGKFKDEGDRLFLDAIKKYSAD